MSGQAYHLVYKKESVFVLGSLTKYFKGRMLSMIPILRMLNQQKCGNRRIFA